METNGFRKYQADVAVWPVSEDLSYPRPSRLLRWQHQERADDWLERSNTIPFFRTASLF